MSWASQLTSWLFPEQSTTQSQADDPSKVYREMDDDSDDSDVYDAVPDKFGKDEIVLAYRDPKRVKHLVDSGQAVTANAINAACYTGSQQMLEILLAAKPDPNIRLDVADQELSNVEKDWAKTDLTPNIGVDKKEWYPLQHAATGPMNSFYGGKKASDVVANALLDHKPNLFAVFKQPIWHSDPFPFPGEQTSEEIDYGGDEALECMEMVDGEWQKKPVPECGYGLRSVLHSLLEDGAYVHPILTHPNLQLDINHRDPQGRTLLHSACRNAVGADAITSAVVEDIYEEGRNKPLIAADDSSSSLFHTIRQRGANLNALDDSGKNILHHLFEARTPHGYSTRPPLIINTLNYVLKNVPELLNQPDAHGTYPLHSALQRLRGKPQANLIWYDDSPLEPVISTLLDAGAKPTVHDSRGNTALHYLADNGLAEQWRGTEARALCQSFCDAGVDVNTRNKHGRTALEILMDDDAKRHEDLWSRNLRSKEPLPSLAEIDAEVFGMLDGAGARWAERDGQGRTLLHVVARYETPKTKFRVEYLLGKGVDPGVKDTDGRTAVDVARAAGNKIALEGFESKE